MPRRKPIPVLSLFCGAGGLDLGFQKAGFKPTLAIDHNQAAVDSYNRNAAEPVAVRGDLRSRSVDRVIDRVADLETKDFPRGVIGGPPCQGFSRGNARSDPKDPRNQLPYAYAKILRRVNEMAPLDFFVFENVPGIQDSKHCARFQRIVKRFRDAGFQIQQQIIDACDFGIPQKRRRLFVVGINVAKYPESNFQFPKPKRKRHTVRDAIGHLPQPVFFCDVKNSDEIPYHPNHWTMTPKSKRFRSGSFNAGRSFRQLSWEEPSWTVAYGNREVHVHPNGKRRLSVLEAMLLQDFTEEFVLSGTLSEQFDQVSNAVPPAVGYRIASAIKKLL
jgi:DNA (cytosine-5)-methyltransferase 1